MKAELFDAMMADFEEAIKHRKGQKTRLRISHFPRAEARLKPKEIRRIRVRLGLSQQDFADFLGTSVGSIKSWEQGVRRPQSSALRLLTIAKEKPAALLSIC